VEERASGHLEILQEIERDGLPGLVEVLRQEGLDAVRFILWDITGWDQDYGFLLTLRSDVPEEEEKRVGWEMFVFIEKILVTVLHEGLKRQAGETMDALSDGPEGFYG
jgi:hypothetical protein